MTDAALFRGEGSSDFVPTDAAVGPWDRNVVHGAAVVALFAGRLSPPEHTLARLTVEFLAPVPMAPLVLQRRDPGGGRRVQRHEAVLTGGGREVAVAHGLSIRQGDLDLPEKAVEHASPFDPAAVPPLDEPKRDAADTVGWESFDSRSLIFEGLRVPDDRRTHAWISLAVPVVEGTDLRGVEVAAVAADLAQAAIHRQLTFAEWSYRNAEQTIHLAREPVGRWIGMRCEGLVQPVGAGFNTADLFDAGGRVARSSAALVVERRV